MHVAHYCDYDSHTKSWMLMITDWQHQLLSMDRVVGMTWTKLLGSWVKHLSSSIYICLITRTQRAVQHEDGTIIQAPDGEVFCSEAVGLSRGREEGWPMLLTFSPSCTCKAGWSLKSSANNGRRRHWRRTRRQTERLISVRPKKMTKFTMEYCCKSSFKCGVDGMKPTCGILIAGQQWTLN